MLFYYLDVVRLYFVERFQKILNDLYEVVRKCSFLIGHIFLLARRVNAAGTTIFLRILLFPVQVLERLKILFASVDAPVFWSCYCGT